MRLTDELYKRRRIVTTKRMEQKWNKETEWIGNKVKLKGNRENTAK